MFERFTERAREVVTLAQAEARRLGQRQIGTEHLLLGMLEEGEGLAAQVLQSSGLIAARVREELLARVERGEAPSEGQLQFTVQAKLLLELGLRESLRLGHDHVDIEHLLLGLSDLREGGAIRILSDLRVGPDTVRLAVAELMGRPVGQAAIHREREPARIRGELADWVQIAPSEDLRRLLAIVATRVSDSGRCELEPADLLLGFTLTPGPALAAGLRLSFDESGAARERDRAWVSQRVGTVDQWVGIGPSAATRRMLMTAVGGALIRGSSVIELDDLLLALVSDEALADTCIHLGLDRHRTGNAIRREHALSPSKVA